MSCLQDCSLNKKKKKKKNGSVRTLHCFQQSEG